MRFTNVRIEVKMFSEQKSFSEKMIECVGKFSFDGTMNKKGGQKMR